MPEFERLQTEEEMEAILAIAARKSGLSTQGTVRERMRNVAGELGISDSALAEAEQEYYDQIITKRDFAAYKIERRNEFLGHVTSFLGVNVGLMLLDSTFNSRHMPTWSLIVAAAWSIGLFVHIFNFFLVRPTVLDDEFVRFANRRRKRDSRHRDRSD